MPKKDWEREAEIDSIKEELAVIRKLFITRMTEDSEFEDKRRNDNNKAIFRYVHDETDDLAEYADLNPWAKKRTEAETKPVGELNMEMVLECFDNAVKDWRIGYKKKGVTNGN